MPLAMSKAYRTRDSISANPMIVMSRIGPAAPGLRDIASAAAEVARPCAIAPAAAAIPSRKAALIAPQRTPDTAVVAAAGSCASAGSARQASATNPTINAFFDIRASPSSFSDGISMFFVSREQTDVDGRESDEDECLEK